MATAIAYREAQTDMPTVDEPGPGSLEKLHDTLEIPGYRVEILEGRIVVNPSPAHRHGLIVTWLTDALQEVCEDRGWARNAHSTVELPATRERIEPDLLVCTVDEEAMDEWLIPARDAVLVVEVVSPSSRRDDYEVKWLGCALSGIPLYLVVDPAKVIATVFSQPSEDGYLVATPVAIGGKVTFLEPVGVTLDTATMPVRRGEKSQDKR